MSKARPEANKIARLTLSVALPLAFYLGCIFIQVSSILWLIPFTFVLVLLFAIPFIVTLSKIKNEPSPSVKPLIFTDLLYYLIPTITVSFLLGLFLYIFFPAFKHVFMLTIILFMVTVFTCLVFWLSYIINNALSKRFGDK